MDALTTYLEQNRDRFVDDLVQWLRIPSVSAQVAHKADCVKAAEHLAARLTSIGMTRAEVIPTAGHPVVYAEWLGAPGAKTVVVYGHYDVQPPEPLELWKTPPFEPVVRDGKLFARGAVDDKGQVYMHVNAIEAHLKTNGKLPVNLRLVIEGEEEVGSESLEAFLVEWKDRLKGDLLVVSDTAMLGPEQPAITYGLRGILYTEIEVVGPQHDLHSGHFGGAVQNPGNALCEIVAKLKDADGRITVPGFYDGIRPLDPAEREMLRQAPFDEAAFLGEAGAPEPFGEKGWSTLERTSVRPTCDVNGIWGGYQGEGSKTVLPSFAAAKVSMRLVPDQDANALFDVFAAYVKKLAPPGVTVTVKNLHGATPWVMAHDHPLLACARRALDRAWSRPAVMMREGGSIPIVATFERLFGWPVILMGFGLDDDNVHAPNEKFSLSSYHGGTKSVAYLYEEIARG